MNRDIRLARTVVDVSRIRGLVRPETSLTGYVPSVPSGVAKLTDPETAPYLPIEPAKALRVNAY
jgi:hypothetical protein